MTKLYKFLHQSGRHIISAHDSTEWQIGQWQTIDGEPMVCQHGFHGSKQINQAFSYVQGNVLAIVEVRGKSDKQDDKECWSEMRLVKAYKWQRQDSVALAIYAAELVIDIFEKRYSDDKRPRTAIEAAKKYLEQPTKKNARAASAAAARAASAAKLAADAAYAAVAARAARAAYAADAAARAADAAYAAYAAYAAEAAARAARAAALAARAAAAAKLAAARAASAAKLAAADAAAPAAQAAATIQKKIEKFLQNRIKELEEIT